MHFCLPFPVRRRLSRPLGSAAAALILLGSVGASAQTAPAQPAAPVAATAAASAAPPASETTSTDPVARFLFENHLVEPVTNDATSVARQLRDKAGNVASNLVLSAMNFLGVPYRRGGESAQSGFDCSGFTRYVFEHSLGLVLPRRAEEQAHAPGMLSIPRDQLKPGDLVFFNTVRHAFSHVGIYVGDNKFIHAPRPGGEVRIEDMNVAYWVRRYDGARRVPQADKPGVAAALSDTPSPR